MKKGVFQRLLPRIVLLLDLILYQARHNTSIKLIFIRKINLSSKHIKKEKKIMIFWVIRYLQIVLIKSNGQMSRANNFSNSHQTHANQSTIPQQSKKIFCAYHPTEYLTNFCCELDCLMPLCPNCIVQHTEQHFIDNTKPTYVNVLDAIAETKQRCYQNIILFEELNKSNDRLYDYILGLRESIHNQLMEDKQDIFREIDQLFEQYEEKLYDDTIAHYKKMEVYDRKETAAIGDFISEQIEVIHEQIGILKGESCLAGLINFYKNDGKIYEDSLKEIGEYIDKHNQAGKICINAEITRLKETLEGFCQKNLIVEFLSQEQAKQEQKMKQSQPDRDNREKGLALKLGQQRHQNSYHQVSASNVKENNPNHTNQDYKDYMDYKQYAKKSEDYYRIDPIEAKTNKFSRQGSHRHF